MSNPIKVLAVVAVLALSLTAVAACGGDDDDDTAGTTATTGTTETAPTPSGGGGETNLRADADPSGALKFTKTSLSAKPGRVTITMDNPSPVPHAVSIRGNGVDVDGNTVEKGGTSTVTADLEPGTYEFYCPVDGHEQAGMKGTLTVK